MSKIILFLLALSTLASCASKSKFYEDHSHMCYQSKDAEDKSLYDCASFDNEREIYKWHRVKPWRNLGDMPDLQ